jgi:hypothetical protein
MLSLIPLPLLFRVGMLGWAVLVLNFCIASIQLKGWQLGPVVHSLLLNLYLLK